MSPRCPGTLAPTIGTVISAPGLARVWLTNQRAVETALPLALAAGAGDQSRSVAVAASATTTITTQTLARYHWRRGLPVLAGVFSTPKVQLEVPCARRSHRRFLTIQAEGQVHRGPALPAGLLSNTPRVIQTSVHQLAPQSTLGTVLMTESGSDARGSRVPDLHVASTLPEARFRKVSTVRRVAGPGPRMPWRASRPRIALRLARD